MSKILFISNKTNKLTNFSLPSIKAAKELDLEFHLASNLEDFDDNSVDETIIYHDLNLSRNPLNLNNIKSFLQLKRIINNEKFDIIHCNTPVGGLLGRICGFISNTPIVIYTAHGFHFYEGGSILKNTIYKNIEKLLARFTTCIITINNEDYQAAKKFKLKKKGKVYYVPGVGVDTSIEPGERISKDEQPDIVKDIKKANSEAIIIISVGELNSNKNQEVVINALKKMKNRNVHYLICGVGENETNLINMISNTAIENNVHFLGYRNDIDKLLLSSDIFLLPSFREGLSRSLMEAMDSKLPCIVSDIRGNRDLIENGVGGSLFDPKKSEELEIRLDNLIGNKKLREQMGDYNFNKVKSFDTKIVEKNILSIYKDQIKERCK